MSSYLGKQVVLPANSEIDNPPEGFMAVYNKNGTITFNKLSNLCGRRRGIVNIESFFYARDLSIILNIAAA